MILNIKLQFTVIQKKLPECKNSGSFFDSYTSNSYGPVANAGFRLGVGKQHKNIEIRPSYMKGINESKPNVMGLAAAFNF